MSLTMTEVSVHLGGTPVLDDISLGLKPGEFLALVGGNGSGKSTLVRAAMGLVPIASGSIRLFDVPFAQFSQWERVGYVPQRTTAASGVPATVGEVVMSGRLARRRIFGLGRRADTHAVHEAIALVDLENRINDPVVELSGGQQQRVLIARALATKPELLVMDEPTAGVDHEHQIQLAATFGRLAEQGCAILFVTHELGPFAEHIDRTVVLAAGRKTLDTIGIAPVPEQHQHPHSGEPETDADLRGEGMWR